MNSKLYLLSLLCLAVSFSAAAQTDTTHTEKKKERKVDFAGIPTVSFNRSRGVGFGGMGMMFFKLGNKPTTPPSRVSINAQYTTKKNWMVGGIAQFFMWDDFLRFSVAGGYFGTHFQTYVDADNFDSYALPTATSSTEIPYDTRGFSVVVSPLFKVYKHLYVGPTIQIFHTNVEFEMPDSTTKKEINNSNALGGVILYDTKDNQYNPAHGWTINVRFNNNGTWLGNDSTFNKLLVFANYYVSLNNSLVLASRFSANVGLGDVPFTSQSYVGNKDIRGYTKGEYRGNQVYALQSELRWLIYKRWGAVAFFGLAMTADPKSQLLPGGGIGARFKIIPKYNINAGLDGAVGKDDWGIYFRITEAF